jgi:hypothetical protein
MLFVRRNPMELSKLSSLPLPVWAAAFGLGSGLLLVVLASSVSPIAAGGAAVGVLVVAAILARPGLGMLITAACVPVERLGRVTSDSALYTVSMIRVAGSLTLGAFLLHALVQRKKVRFGVESWMYTIFLLLAVLSISYTNDYEGSIKQCGSVLGNLLFFFLVINIIRTPRFAKAAAVMWLLASVGCGLYTMYDWHFHDQAIEETNIGTSEDAGSAVVLDPSEWQTLGGPIRRALGTTSHSAVYGINLILTLPFFAFFIERSRFSPVIRVLLFGGLVIVLYNIFLTNTRATMLIAAMVLGLCALFKLVRMTPMRVIGLVLAIVSLLPFVPEAVWDRVLDVTNYTYEKSGTLRARLEYWDIGLKLLETNWWCGTGAGDTMSVPKYLKEAGATSTSVHNEYLQTLLESGVFAWAMFFSFVFVVMRCSFKSAARFKRAGQEEAMWFMVACQIAMIGTLIYGVQVDVFHFPLKGWWLVAGMSVAMYQITNVPEQQEKGEPPSTAGRTEDHELAST